MPLARFRIRTLMIAVAVVAGGFGVGLYLWNSVFGPSYITLRVVNDTKAPLTNVTIQYTGGAVRAASIPPGTSDAWRIRVQGESDLDLSYRDTAGKTISKDDNAYLEGGYYGSFVFHVETSAITTVNRIRSWP